MSIAPSKVASSQDWDQVREEWVADLDALYRRVEAWSVDAGWETRRDLLSIDHDMPNPYQAWTLEVRAPEGRLVLQPIARWVTGATGLIDLIVLPSIDASMMLVRHDDGRWVLHPFGDMDVSTPWTREDFLETARTLFARSH